MRQPLLKAHPYRVKAGGKTYLVVYRRKGVEPSMASLYLLPLWLYTRLRWQMSDHRPWVVEVSEQRRSGLGGRRISTEEVADEPSARLLAQAKIADPVSLGADPQ
ncbi:MAG: hypothetical protein JWM47_2589 [Acidimicrobiales bacterium]|nr:hypothetical protein [Acidimicrobiales bacterium]